MKTVSINKNRKLKPVYNGFIFIIGIFLLSSGKTHNLETSKIENSFDKQLKKTVLITGSNRGLGLEMARQFSADGYHVIGTARKPERATELKKLNVQVEQLDVTNEESINALVKKLKGQKIDILINNAGYYGPFKLDEAHQKIDALDIDGVERCFQVNSLGPIRVTKALLPNLYLGEERKIVNISTRQSILAHSYQNNRKHGLAYGYKMSKVALNMFTRVLAGDLAQDGFIVVSLAPGWVKTDMGTHLAELKPEESIRDVKNVIENLTKKQNGGFWFHDGTMRPW